MKPYTRLLTYLRPYVWWRGVAAVVAMLAFSAVEGSIPFLFKIIVDKGSEYAHLVAVGVLVTGVLRGGLDFVSTYLSDWIGQRVVTDLRNQLTAHLQALDLAFFNRQRAGQIASRVMGDAILVRDIVTNALTSLFQDVTRLFALMGAAIYLDWRLATFAAGLFPVASLAVFNVSRQIRATTRKRQEIAAQLNAALLENIQGNRVVKAFGQEDYEVSRFKTQTNRWFKTSMKLSMLNALPITELLAGIFLSGIIFYGGSSVANHTRTAGDFVAFVVSIGLLYEPFKRLVRTYNNIQQGLAGADRVFALLDTKPAFSDRPDAVQLGPVRDAIEFHDVSFAYDRGDPVLRHITLRIPVGQVVALVGMSGGGKSTLADLIPRFYDVTEGRITVDGLDLRDVTFASLRAQIALVTQFTFLFNDSVRNNIAYGDVTRSTEEIVAAARAANAHDFITELPKGYDTHIGDLGVRLSGGQRQRLAIARAILKNAPILILDEATSALDTESEGLVQEALERLMANRTTLVVAHRLSTVRRADRIVVVVRGGIIESGTHEELMARGAEYRKLYELQFRDADTPEEPPADGAEGAIPPRTVAG